jgi:ankyrin repeat protein
LTTRSSYEPLDVSAPEYLGYTDLTNFDNVVQMRLPDNFDQAERATITPWPVQELLSSAFQQSFQSTDNVKAGLSALNLSICYSVGLGVERDTERLLYWLRRSAEKGCREARIIVRNVHGALGASYDEEVVPLELEANRMESYLATLEAATRRTPYTTPFHDLWQVKLLMFWTLLPSKNEDELLHRCVLLGTPEEVSELLRAGFQDQQDKHGQTALLLACRRGHLEIAKLFLDAGSNASIADNEGRTPLHMLVMFPAHEVVQAAGMVLSSPKVDINAVVHKGERAPDYWAVLHGAPLDWAVLCGNRTATKVLIDNGADVTSAIFAAVSLHLDDILHMLLEAPQCRMDTKELGHCFCALTVSHPFRRMLMHGADSKNAMQRTIDVLRSAWNASFNPAVATPGLSPHDPDSLGIDEIGLNPVVLIAGHNLSHQDPDIVRALLRLTHVRSGQLADEAVDRALLGCGSSEFESNNRITMTLIEAEFPLRAKNEVGWSPIHSAANLGNSVVMEAILRQDPASVNLRAPEGTTPLHLAVKGMINPLRTIKILLNYGANPALTSFGSFETPLGTYIHYGTLHSVRSVLPLLIELGQSNDFTAVRSGETWHNALPYAAWFAAAYEFRSSRASGMLREVLQQSELRGLIDLPASDGYTALLSVCHNVHLASARMLIDAGADIFARNRRGLNCLDLAMFRTRSIPSRRLPHNTYAKRLPEAYELCTHLAQVLKDHGRDPQYTSLHIAAFIGYEEQVVKIVQQNPSQALALDSEGFQPRELLMKSILSQHVGKDTYLASCDPAFVERAARLEQMLHKIEIQASGEIGQA